MNFQEDIPSIPNDNFKDHCVRVFDLTSMQDAISKLSFSRTSWGTTEAGDKLNFSSGTRYWTDCIGGTNVFSCCQQV